jgi:hypothetical protein
MFPRITDRISSNAFLPFCDMRSLNKQSGQQTNQPIAQKNDD